MKKTFLFILSIFCLEFYANAQTVTPELTIENLKTVEELIAIATSKSSTMKAIDISQQQTGEEISMDKKKWMQHLSLNAGVNYGNGIISDQMIGDQSTTLTYLTRQNVTYNVGVNIRLPFTEVSSRKNQIKIRTLEIEKLDYLKLQEQEQLKKEIVKLYSDLRQLISTIEIQASVVESNALALSVAEGYFKAGKLPVDQYKTAVESNFSAQLLFEKAKNDTWFTYNTLKTIVGEEILK